jgi:adenosyl cobinamide kinase/adenosyl cobinamide phosphate guanylyltransferase
VTVLLLLGGARSGKSALATRLARGRAGAVWFVATAEPRDEEMAERIRTHRSERPPEWTVREEPRDLEKAFDAIPSDATVVLDCLTLWVSNLIEDRTPEEINVRAANLAQRVRARTGFAIVVSNEVGLGLVPPNPLGRAYRDVLGQVNARWAEAADDVLLLVAGRAVPLAPVDVGRWSDHHG